MTEQQKNPAVRYKRRRFLVHNFQKKYAVGLSLLLFTYSLVPFGLAFLVPYVIPGITLFSSVPPEEQAQAASQILALSQVALPALVVLIAGAAAFSVYMTHRIAGPLYRLEQSTKELASGNLSLRIRFRKGDELHDLADSTNLAIANIDQALLEIRSRGASGREALQRALEELRSQSATSPAQVSHLELALKEVEQVEGVLRRFRLSKSG